ncbi:DUF3280 domain-containing protein [Paraburkholderia sartisoli]|uniref:DUF2380 domain-containing protein n=1 Tax=Paraburkholderia sartisoli TaxID=83784 RepID=A0A1H4A4I7_9BURK|nr:DUF3280 domain-containing protein [Paraburkholderia sartisoli]SEA30847.1 Protein of unknown function [Paraburkholderia sartisoli]
MTRLPGTPRLVWKAHVVVALMCACAAALPAETLAQPAGTPSTIAVPDCTLIDDNAAYNDADVTRVQQLRVTMISDQLRNALRERGLYRVADNAPAAAMIASLQSMQDLNACNGCEREVGRRLNAGRVGLCWVQKISNLILNINLRIEDVATGATVFQRSVDIRGNTDLSWRRGVDALVDLVAQEQKQK